jgi:hypothetical protein
MNAVVRGPSRKRSGALFAPRSGAREEVELAGLEPATSWVRYRQDELT